VLTASQLLLIEAIFSGAIPMTCCWNPSEIAPMDSRHGFKAYPVPIESEPGFSFLF
jgi:hypothetical protein